VEQATKPETRKNTVLCCNTVISIRLILNLYNTQLSREACQLCLYVPVYYDLVLAMNMNSRTDQSEAFEEKIGVK
jgi:hypothetical protein